MKRQKYDQLEREEAVALKQYKKQQRQILRAEQRAISDEIRHQSSQSINSQQNDLARRVQSEKQLLDRKYKVKYEECMNGPNRVVCRRKLDKIYNKKYAFLSSNPGVYFYNKDEDAKQANSPGFATDQYGNSYFLH